MKNFWGEYDDNQNYIGKYNLDNFFNISLINVNNLSSNIKEDYIVSEFPLGLVVNSKYENTFLCTPSNLEELITGYLCFKNLIRHKEDIIELKFDNSSRMAYVKIKQPKFSENENTIYLNEYDFIKTNAVSNNTLKIKATQIYDFMNLNLKSQLFADTAGVHNISIYDKNKLVISCEDVARHNAMDKAIGYCILNNIPLDDKIIFVSGRLSFEMIRKVARVNIPIVVAKSATTALAIETAQKLNITLVGFVRGKKMNIYTNPHRIIFE